VKRSFTSFVGVSAARSSYAKDCEHPSLGRSPGSWLQTLLILPSHSIQNSGWLSLSWEDELLTSYSSATAPDLHRLPYLPDPLKQATQW